MWDSSRWGRIWAGSLQLSKCVTNLGISSLEYSSKSFKSKEHLEMVWDPTLSLRRRVVPLIPGTWTPFLSLFRLVDLVTGFPGDWGPATLEIKASSEWILSSRGLSTTRRIRLLSLRTRVDLQREDGVNNLQTINKGFTKTIYYKIMGEANRKEKHTCFWSFGSWSCQVTLKIRLSEFPV